MPNKPDKYGVKFWVLADVETKYVSNIDVYLGAQEKEQRDGVPLAESVVVNLCKHIKGKGYNITRDNFFTSLSVAEKLARDKLSIVGTIRKSRRQLCKKMTELENFVFFVLFAIFILHSRESELYRYTMDGKSALAWELPFSRFMGHLSST